MRQVGEIAVEVFRRRVDELDIDYFGWAQRAADDAFGEAVHLHLARATEGFLDPGADAGGLAEPGDEGGDVSDGERVLYAEDENAAGGQHSDEFLEVAYRKALRHVLQHDVAIDECEAGVIELQNGVEAGDVLAVRVTVESVGFVDHVLGDVYADAGGEALREGLGEAADATSEVQGCAFGLRVMADLGEMVHDDADLCDARGHKVGDAPLALLFSGIGKDGVKRVLLGEAVPDIA